MHLSIMPIRINNSGGMGLLLHCIHPFNRVFVRGRSETEEWRAGREGKGGELTHATLTADAELEYD